jgi:hypothetical protein
MPQPRIRPRSLSFSAARVALEQIADIEETNRGHHEPQHLPQRDRFGELGKDRQRRNRQTHNLQQSSQRIHGQQTNIRPNGRQAAWHRSIAIAGDIGWPE